MGSVASNWAARRYYRQDEHSEGPSFPDLLLLADGGDRQALRALDQMAHAIGRGMRPIIAALSPGEIVFVGEFARMWSHMGPIIEQAVQQSVLVGPQPRIRPAAAEPSVAPLRGTVALVLQKHFGPAAATEKRQYRFAEKRSAARLQ